MENDTSTSRPIDRAKLTDLRAQLRSRQSLPRGILGATFGSLIGIAAWAAFTASNGLKNEFLVLGIGLLTAVGMRLAGRGVDLRFAITGSLISAIGAMVGWFVADAAASAAANGENLADAIAGLFDRQRFTEWRRQLQGPRFSIFVLLTAYLGFRLSHRRLTMRELSRIKNE